MSKERTPYLFAPEIKKEALELSDYSCEYCGQIDRKGGWLEAHHICAIFFAREMGIAAEVIKSIANCAITCHDCHSRAIHMQESRYEYAILAYQILGVDTNPDLSKDDWRKDPNHSINKHRNKKKRRK